MAGFQSWEVSESARVLRTVDTAEGQLAVGVIIVAASLGGEVDTEHFSRDGTLLVQVVHEGGDRVGVGNGVLGKIHWTEANDAVDALETLSGGGGTNGLGLDGQASEADFVSVFGARERAAAVADRDGSSGGFSSRSRLAIGLSTTPGVRS